MGLSLCSIIEAQYLCQQHSDGGHGWKIGQQRQAHQPQVAQRSVISLILRPKPIATMLDTTKIRAAIGTARSRTAIMALTSIRRGTRCDLSDKCSLKHSVRLDDCAAAARDRTAAEPHCTQPTVSAGVFPLPARASGDGFKNFAEKQQMRRLRWCYCHGWSGSSCHEELVMPNDQDWTRPAMMAIPKEGYFEEQRGRYGPIFPRTPACYGFTIFAKVIPGREEAIREHGRTLEAAVTADPTVLEVLKLHYLKWQLIPVGEDLYFQYQGIFDTDFDKYTEDAVALFSKTGIDTVFTNLVDFPEDWKENPASFVEYVREHHVPSFVEYGEYPYVTADEIKKALRLKDSFSNMLDQMQ
jgi:hypothetical protein